MAGDEEHPPKQRPLLSRLWPFGGKTVDTTTTTPRVLETIKSYIIKPPPRRSSSLETSTEAIKSATYRAVQAVRDSTSQLPSTSSIVDGAKGAWRALPSPVKATRDAADAVREGISSTSRQITSTIGNVGASEGMQRAKSLVVDAAPRIASGAAGAVFGGARRAVVGLQYRVLAVVVLGVFAYGVGSALPHALAEYRLKARDMEQHAEREKEAHRDRMNNHAGSDHRP
eukprot:Opistho-2@88773